MSKGRILIENLSVIYRNNICAVKNLNFEVNPRELVCLIGSNGCGKTTVLYAIANYIKYSGRILLDGEQMNMINPKIGVIFQQYNLFPWKTVLENINFGLKFNNTNKKERDVLIKRYINLMKLNGFENCYPSQLSGGMQQRVAIARTLVTDPEIILMDEPFSSLDAQTRFSMCNLLFKIWNKYKKTIIFVTHDIDESIYLADRILVMAKRPGRVKKEFKVNLKRPRTFEITLNQDYLNLKSKIFRLLKEEESI